MSVRTYEDVEIDKCGSCNGIFLDAGELEKIKEKIESDNSSDPGFSTGFLLGMVL